MTLTDEQLQRRVEKQNRRTERNHNYRRIYRWLSSESSMRYRSRPSQCKAAAKMIAMKISQLQRKAA